MQDLRGLGQLLVEGVTATTDLVEAVHAGILGMPGRLLGAAPSSTVRGIPRLAYQGVRGTARAIGRGADHALSRIAPLLATTTPLPQREALVAALNGVLGDHLSATGNPLALGASLRCNGQVLVPGTWAAAQARPTARVLVLVHGLCMNDLQWHRNGHDHGARLAADLGYTAVYLRYNTGLPIAGNGQALSALLDRMCADWPVPIERFAILCHSMGGLVARAGMVAARGQSHSWLERLDRVVFLGTPHHGAPLERAGNALQSALALTPWTAPFARLGRIRSAGIRDLRHGIVHDGLDAPLPADVRAYAVAASTQPARAGKHGQATDPVGDGLVPVASAFGEHPDPRRSLRIPASRRLLVHRTSHLGLLDSGEVYARLRRWLA